MAEHYSWLNLLVSEHVAHQYGHVIFAGLTVAILLVFSLLARMGIGRRADKRIPEDRLTFANIAELAVDGLGNLCEDVIGHGGRKYLWLLGSIFLYIFTANFLGLLPGFLPPTDNLNTNLGVSVLVFLSYNIFGLKEHGFGYLKHFMGPILFLAPLMVVIELISHLVRPASLAIRLFGNIFGDHLVLGIFSDLVPIGVPVIFMGLGLFVCFIQAFVFTLLSMVYISLATAHSH